MDRFDDDNLLAAELRAMRPNPRPGFAAELDERAAAGFPRGADTTASVFAPLADWWRGMTTRGRLVPALGAAALVVVIATAAVSISQSGGHGGSGGADFATLNSVPGAGESGVGVEESSEAASGEARMAPAQKAPKASHAHKNSGSAGGHHGGASPSDETVYAPEVPSVEAAPNAAAGAAGQSSEAAGLEEEPESAEEAEATGAPAIEAPKNAGLAQRDIERSSYIVLGTKPGHVSAAAAKVFAAVHAAHGIVLHSSVQSGSKGATGASFSLLIPSAKVDDALGEISGVAEVRARHDATNDITAPTVGAAEELADSNASIESLLKQLGDAETETEQESLETRLREERSRHAAIRSSLDHLHERASMSEVSVRIVTGNGAGVAPPSKGSGDSSWGVGDALHDAGNILTVAAGVVLIGLAILGPIALIAIALWGGHRFRIRRLRERTLG